MSERFAADPERRGRDLVTFALDTMRIWSWKLPPDTAYIDVSETWRQRLAREGYDANAAEAIFYADGVVVVACKRRVK